MCPTVILKGMVLCKDCFISSICSFYYLENMLTRMFGLQLFQNAYNLSPRFNLVCGILLTFHGLVQIPHLHKRNKPWHQQDFNIPTAHSAHRFLHLLQQSPTAPLPLLFGADVQGPSVVAPSLLPSSSDLEFIQISKQSCKFRIL